MEKMDVLCRIFERRIEIPFQQEIVQLLKKNVERIEFVKDHVGLRDFLFIAEKETGFSSELFVALNTYADPQQSFKKNDAAFKRAFVNDPSIIKRELTAFFHQTNRILCVGVGFIESDIGEEVYEKAVKLFQKGGYEIFEEVLRKVRVFPAWYEESAKFPEEIIFETKTAEKQRIMNEIEQILTKKTHSEQDEAAFKEWSDKYKHAVK